MEHSTRLPASVLAASHSDSGSASPPGNNGSNSYGQRLPLAATSPDPRPDHKKHVTKLLTLSPEAIRVAAEITPHRLANLLIRKGPLAIRLITAQLAVEVPGFELLSLSKQRRLIMAAMDQGDPENNVVFEKIGWGQWAVRKVDSDYIVTEADSTSDNPKALLNIHELKEKAKLGWLKKSATLEHKDARRDSISNLKPNLHNVRLPNERLGSSSAILDSDSESEDDDMDVLKFRMSVSHMDLDDIEVDDNAIAEDLDVEDDAELFDFDNDDEQTGSIGRFKRSPPVKFAKRVPTKFSPPPALLGSRRKSSSAGAPSSVTKNTNYNNSTRHQIFNRSRLNLIENLDNYIVSSARNSQFSVSSPPPQAGSVPTASPLGSWNGNSGYLTQNANILPENIASAMLKSGRRKLSFNELSIRSTLLTSLQHKIYENGAHAASNGSIVNRSYSPPSTNGTRRPTSLRHDIASDTDEEDWATIGAESLRKHSAGLSSPGRTVETWDERTAARALVDLMSN